jgi:hypothetical protein
MVMEQGHIYEEKPESSKIWMMYNAELFFLAGYRLEIYKKLKAIFERVSFASRRRLVFRHGMEIGRVDDG